VILVEIRPRGGGEPTTITVHPKVTVLAGLDAAARRTWAIDLGRALQGGTAASLDVEVDVDGSRRPLTEETARALGLGDAGCEVTVFPLDLPGAAPAAVHEPAPEPPSEPADEPVHDGAVAAAESALEAARARLAQAEQEEAAALADRDAAAAQVEPDAAAELSRLEAALDSARSETARARREVEDTETRMERVREMASAERNEKREAVQKLKDERDRLEAERTELVARMVEVGDPGDPKAVETALAGLRRLQSVRPKPSARAIELADAWVEAYERLAALPAPPQPPEWLVAPALAALQEAKAAVAEAERGGPSVDVDPALVAALDRAHGEVLEAEQRVMRKGSRANRKRLDSAHAAEHSALGALGVGTYGEYLQRIAPMLGDGGSSREERLASARAALADAEAVWEELHDGQASPEWTAAKQHQAGVRQQAQELLGKDVDDADLEAALRNHVETVVDTGWAEQALVDALEAAGVALPMPPEDATAADLDGVADSWLRDAPAKREQRAALDAELVVLDDRYAVVEEQLAAKQADAFFGDDEGGDDDVPDTFDGSPTLSERREALAAAEEKEREAEVALEAARGRAGASAAAEERRSELEQVLDERRRATASARDEVEAAESALAEARRAADDAVAAADAAKAADRAARAATPAPSPNGAADLSQVVGMEAEAYLLARVAALRGAAAGPLPLVLDGAVLSGLSERASRRVYRLLARLADSMQLVVLADDEETTRWAEGLGESAAVHSVTR
jgi:hypothetical protein